jgi:hypothetical protein
LTISGLHFYDVRTTSSRFFEDHGSYVNRTTTTRRIALFQFRSPSGLPLKETHRSPGQGLMLRGVNPEPSRIPRRIEKAGA